MKYIKEYNEYVDPFNEEDWDEVEPDGTFLTWLKHDYPDESKWKHIVRIIYHKQDLTDLIGIDKLINLEYLNCHNNQLTELDLSKNIKLNELSCNNNQLIELDLSKNINLEYLFCFHNQLTELDISNSISLIKLLCDNNQLKELDVSNNIKLKYENLHYDDNPWNENNYTRIIFK